MPRPNPGQQGLKSDVAVTPAVATAAAPEEGIAVGGIGSLERIAHNATELRLDVVPHIFVAQPHVLLPSQVVQHFLSAALLGLDNGGCVHRAVITQLVDVSVCSAAILLS